MSNGEKRSHQTLSANSSSEVVLIPLLGKEKRDVNQEHELSDIGGEGGWFTRYSSIIKRFSVIPIQDLTAPGGWMKTERGLNEFSWSEGCFRFHFVVNEGGSGDSSTYGNSVWAQLQAHRHVYGAIGLVHAPSIGKNTSLEDLDRELDGYTNRYDQVMVKRVFVFDHNFEAGSIPGFNATRHVVLPPAPEGLEPLEEATIMERFLTEPLYDVAVNLINGYDAIIKYCLLVFSSSSSTSPAVKAIAKNSMLPSLSTPLNKNPTDSDSSGGGGSGFFENISSKRGDRQNLSRLRKYAGDISLLSGSPKDAMYFYDSALSELKSDHVWLAAALEGSAATFAAIKDPDHPIAISSELFSLISKVVITSPSLAPGPYGGGTTAEVGSEGGVLIGGNLDMVSRVVVDRCISAMKYMSEKKELRMLELELLFKLARFHLSNGIVDATIDCVLHAQDIPMSNSRYEVERAMEIAVLCYDMGLRRKAAFFFRIASLQCREIGDWDMSHVLAGISARAYGIQLSEMNEPHEEEEEVAAAATMAAASLISQSSVVDESNTMINNPSIANSNTICSEGLIEVVPDIQSNDSNGNGRSFVRNEEIIRGIDQPDELVTERSKECRDVGEEQKEDGGGKKSLPVWSLDPRKFSRGRRLWIALQKDLLQDLLTGNMHCGGSKLESLQYYLCLLRIVAAIESSRIAYDAIQRPLMHHPLLSDHAGGGGRNAVILDKELLSSSVGGGSEYGFISSLGPAASSVSLGGPGSSKGGDKAAEQLPGISTTDNILTTGPSTTNENDSTGTRSPSSTPSTPVTRKDIRMNFSSLHKLGWKRESTNDHVKDRTSFEGDGGESSVVAHRKPVPVKEQVELINGMIQCVAQLSLSIPHTTHYPPSHRLSTSVYCCPLYPSLSVPDIPYMESAHPIQLPPNMEPVVGPIGDTEGKQQLRGRGVYNTASTNNKDQAVDAVASVKDPIVGGFYFNPYVIGKATGPAGNEKQQPRRWVVGEMCFVHAEFSNPLSVSVEATKVEAAVEGADTHVYATSFTLPPHAKNVPIQLSVKPKEPGNLTLRGVYMTIFGLPILCPIRSSGRQSSHSVVTPVWEYLWPPKEETMKPRPQPRKCNEREGGCGAAADDEKIITSIVLCPPMPCLVPWDATHSDMEITIHPGERCVRVIAITNRNDTPIGALELWLEMKSGNSLLFSSQNQNQNQNQNEESTIIGGTMADEDLRQGDTVVQQQQQQPMTPTMISCDTKTLSHQLKLSSLLGVKLLIPLIIHAGSQGQADTSNAGVEDPIEDATLIVIYSSGHEAPFTRHMKLPLTLRVVPGLRFLGVRVRLSWHDSLVLRRGISILNDDETDAPHALIELRLANDSTLPVSVYSKAPSVTVQLPPSGTMVLLPGSTQSLLMRIKRRWIEAPNESIIIGEKDEGGLSDVKQQQQYNSRLSIRCWKEQKLLNFLSDLLTVQWFMATINASDTILRGRVMHSGCLSFPLRYVAKEKGGISVPLAAHIKLAQRHGATALPAVTVPAYLRMLTLPPLRLAVLPHRMSTTTTTTTCTTPMSSSLTNSHCSFPIFDAEKCLLSPTIPMADNEATCASAWNVLVDLHASVPVTVVVQNLTSADTIRVTFQLSTKVRDDTGWIDIDDEQDEELPIRVVWSGILDACRDVPPKGWAAFGAVAKFMTAGEYVLTARAEWHDNNIGKVIERSVDPNDPAAAESYKPNAMTRSILSHAPLLVKVHSKAETVIKCQESASNRLLHGKMETHSAF